MNTEQPSKPAGAPTGGQFATPARTETSTTIAAPARGDGAHLEADAARDALARALGVPTSDVTVVIDDSHLCGEIAGTTLVRLAAPIPADQRNREVSIGFYRTPSGQTHELACTVSWDREPIPGLEYTSDSTSSAFNRQRPATPDMLRSLVADTLRQAQLQQRLDAAINDPQYGRAARRDLARWHEILRAEARVSSGVAEIAFSDLRGRHHEALALTVDTTGQVLEGHVDTYYGLLRVGTDDLPRVMARLGRELGWAVDERAPEEPSAAALAETRIRAVFTGL